MNQVNPPRFLSASMRRRMPNLLATAVAFVLLTALAAGCGGTSNADEGAGTVSGRQIRVTTTTNFITDMAGQLGGDRVDVEGLMGPGVDPHLYKASAGDVRKLRDADVIFYGGLELEGRMTDLLVELASERRTVAVTKDIPESKLLEPTEFEGKFDPHVWFDVAMWKTAARTLAATYQEIDPEDADEYDRRLRSYLSELDDLDAYAKRRLAEVPEQSRVLVTSHDAFNYFGRRYGFDVEAIQGVSTATEATTADIQRVATVIADRGLKAVFVESSVPRQTIEAVIAAAEDRGQRATIGGELYADAAGSEGTPEGTYIGMVRHNIDLIADGLR